MKNELRNMSKKPKTATKRKLRKNRVVEMAIAVLVTTLVIALTPVLAWFGNQRRVAKLAKIKAPDELYINAAHREDKVYLDMKSVEVSRKYMKNGAETPITAQNYVFSVSGEWVNSFILQMEHTTNNPYKYEIFEGTIYKKRADGKFENINDSTDVKDPANDEDERNEDDGSFAFVEYTATNDFDPTEAEKVEFDDDGIEVNDRLRVYFNDTSPVTGDYLNGSGRTADNTLKLKSYGSYTNVNTYVNPKYWKSNKIMVTETKGTPFYKTYVIKVSWTDSVSTINNYNKETDIVYLSAFVN